MDRYQKLQKDAADRLAANKVRIARYLAGDRYALDDWENEEPVNMKREDAKPDFTQLNDWVDQRCTAIIDTRIDAVVDEGGAFIAEREIKIRDDVREAHGSMMQELRGDLIKKFGDDLNSMRDDLLALLRKDLGIEDNVVDLPNPFSRKA